MAAPVELQAQLTTRTAEIASPAYSGGHYFASMPKAAITDADLARAERIRSAREAQGLNQSELARVLKVSPQTVQLWEKGGGIRGPKQSQLAKALRVTPEWVMFGNLNASPSHSRDLNVTPVRSVRLDPVKVATAYRAIEWRLSLVRLKYSLPDAPHLFALAYAWAEDDSAANLDALLAAVEAEISRQTGGASDVHRPGAAGEISARPRAARRKGG